MKYVIHTIILIVLTSIIVAPLTVSAIDTGLITEELSNEEISDLIKETEFLKIASYSALTLKCFDVRNDHMIVIGSDAGDTAIITVYDDCGNFQYGFETKEPGSFRVMWSGNEIAYYSIRSTLLYKIDKDGQITNISRVSNTLENSIYDRDVLQATIRNVDDTTYRITNELPFADAILGSFKKITKTNAFGTTVIYDATVNQHNKIIVGLVVFGLLLIFIVTSIIITIKNRKDRTQGDKRTVPLSP